MTQYSSQCFIDQYTMTQFSCQCLIDQYIMTQYSCQCFIAQYTMTQYSCQCFFDQYTMTQYSRQCFFDQYSIHNLFIKLLYKYRVLRSCHSDSLNKRALEGFRAKWWNRVEGQNKMDQQFGTPNVIFLEATFWFKIAPNSPFSRLFAREQVENIHHIKQFNLYLRFSEMIVLSLNFPISTEKQDQRSTAPTLVSARQSDSWAVRKSDNQTVTVKQLGSQSKHVRGLWGGNSVWANICQS